MVSGRANKVPFIYGGIDIDRDPFDIIQAQGHSIYIQYIPTNRNAKSAIICSTEWDDVTSSYRRLVAMTLHNVSEQEFKERVYKEWQNSMMNNIWIRYGKTKEGIPHD